MPEDLAKEIIQQYEKPVIEVRAVTFQMILKVNFLLKALYFNMLLDVVSTDI